MDYINASIPNKLSTQRQILLALGLGTFILGGILGGLLVVQHYIKYGTSPDLFIWVLAAVPLALMAIFLFFERRTVRLLKGFKLHSARTCPRCGEDAFDSDGACGHVPNSWSTLELELYWRDRSHSAMMANSTSRGDPPQAMAWWIKHRVETIVGLLALAACLLAVIVTGFILRPALLGNMISYTIVIPVYMIMLAVLLWNKSGVNYAPEGLCSSCGHPIPPDFSKGTCNECGTSIDINPKSRINITQGKKLLFVITLVWVPLLLIQGLGIMNSKGSGALALGILPNLTLIRMTTSRPLNTSLWTELSTRTLTPEERSLLFDLAIEQRQELFYFGKHNELGAWLQAEIDAGNVSAEEFRRIWVDSWIPELVVPAQATAGDPFTVILQGKRREDFQPNSIGTVILFDGFTIDDGPVVGRETNTLWALDADSDKKGAFRHFKSPLSIDKPGTYTLRASYWLMDRPFGKLDDPVERDADGRPIQPLHSTWMIPLTIEQEIEIE